MFYKINCLSFAKSPNVDALMQTLEWSEGLLKSTTDPAVQDVVVQAYAGIVGQKNNRLVFWSQQNCLAGMLDILSESSGGHIQLQYHCLLVVWLLTFETKICKSFNK